MTRKQFDDIATPSDCEKLLDETHLTFMSQGVGLAILGVR